MLNLIDPTNLPGASLSSVANSHGPAARRAIDQVTRVVIFTSPKAGSGANRDQIPRLVEMLSQAGIQVNVTHDLGDLIRLREETAAMAGQGMTTVVVAAGGDGTITLAAAQLGDQAKQLGDQAKWLGDQAKLLGEQAQDSTTVIPMVPMPLGTENLLAGHFGHRADAEFVFNTIKNGIVHAVDLGIVRQERSRPDRCEQAVPRFRPMLTMATCGFDAEVVRRLHLRRKGHIWKSSYLGPIAEAMRDYRFPELLLETVAPDGVTKREIKCGWAMVFNLPCYGGGLAIEPGAIGDDGQLDVIAFHGRSVASGLRYLAGIKMGLHLRFADVTRLPARSVRISSQQRVHFQVDGDYAGRLPIEISINPGAVTLLLPPR